MLAFIDRVEAPTATIGALCACSHRPGGGTYRLRPRAQRVEGYEGPGGGGDGAPPGLLRLFGRLCEGELARVNKQGVHGTPLTMRNPPTGSGTASSPCRTLKDLEEEGPGPALAWRGLSWLHPSPGCRAMTASAAPPAGRQPRQQHFMKFRVG